MRTFLATCVLISVFFGQNVLAQSYPAGPVTIVNPYPAGGSVDLLARRLAENLKDKLNSPFIVVNKLGATGTIAAGAVASAKPDGYTLLIGYTNELVISPWLIKTTYTAKDFEPVVFLGSTPFVLIGRKDLPADTLKEVLALGRTKEGLRYGSSGYGSLPHIAGEMLKHETQMNLLHVPYKGSPQAIGDLLGGHVDLGFSGIPVASDLIRNGRVKVYGVTDSQRAPTLPQVPTMAEAGVKNVELPGWFMLLAPKGTPGAIVDQLRKASTTAIGEPDLQQFFKANAITVREMSPDQLTKFLADQSEKYRQIIKQFGITSGG